MKTQNTTETLRIRYWNIENVTGYKPLTTLYMDFSIADRFGEDAIKSTCKAAFEAFRDNYKYFTELVMVLNWKIWEHYYLAYDGHEKVARLYDELWREYQGWGYDNLKDEELDYFWSTLD